MDGTTIIRNSLFIEIVLNLENLRKCINSWKGMLLLRFDLIATRYVPEPPVVMQREPVIVRTGTLYCLNQT